MASKRKHSKNQPKPVSNRIKRLLKKGDPVMVIAGGHKEKRPNKGQVGNIMGFVGREKDRVLVEGINMISKHQRQTAPDQPSQIIKKEGSVHISNVMYYVEKLKRPVRLKSSLLEDGSKVRGYNDPETKEFVQI